MNKSGSTLEMEHVARKMVEKVPTSFLKLCQQKIAGKHVLKARSVKAMRQIRVEDANYMKTGCKMSAQARGQESKAKIATIKVKIKAKIRTRAAEVVNLVPNRMAMNKSGSTLEMEHVARK